MIFGVVAGVLVGIIWQNLNLGLVVTTITCLAEIIIVLELHDDHARTHYNNARQCYQSMGRLEMQIATRVLRDISAFVSDVERDITLLISTHEERSKSLFARLIRLDLKALEDRIRNVHNDQQFLLDTHQRASHVIVCEAMKTENIRDFSAIYDLRDGTLDLHDLDLAFAAELDGLVKEKLVSVRGLFVLKENGNHDPANLVLSGLGQLSKYFARPGYSVWWISAEEFRRHCGALGQSDALRTIDIGIYGDRYVYQAVEPDPITSIPRGHFVRDPAVVRNFRELFERCVKSSHQIHLPSN